MLAKVNNHTFQREQSYSYREKSHKHVPSLGALMKSPKYNTKTAHSGRFSL